VHPKFTLGNNSLNFIKTNIATIVFLKRTTRNKTTITGVRLLKKLTLFIA